jgi:UDP-glucuronate 4-epimerase
MPERYLITGAYGCIGAWVARELVDAGHAVVTYDLDGDPYRLRLVMAPEQIERVTRVSGDITDLPALERTLDEHAITRVIHLAALQVPFCRENPPLGAAVNVEGTTNVLEAVRRRGLSGPLVYASSIALFGETHGEAASVPERSGPPGTIYGVYKRANESTALVYSQDWGVPSIGLRPHTVYGPGRDQGLTSAPTAAMLAAAAGKPYQIPFGGSVQLQYAPDVAHAFVAASGETDAVTAVHNLTGPVVRVAEIVAAIHAVVPEAADLIDFVDEALPFPSKIDSSSYEEQLTPPPPTPLAEGVRDTVRRFRQLLAAGVIAPEAVPGGARAGG